MGGGVARELVVEAAVKIDLGLWPGIKAGTIGAMLCVFFCPPPTFYHLCYVTWRTLMAACILCFMWEYEWIHSTSWWYICRLGLCVSYIRDRCFFNQAKEKSRCYGTKMCILIVFYPALCIDRLISPGFFDQAFMPSDFSCNGNGRWKCWKRERQSCASLGSFLLGPQFGSGFFFFPR